MYALGLILSIAFLFRLFSLQFYLRKFGRIAETNLSHLTRQFRIIQNLKLISRFEVIIQNLHALCVGSNMSAIWKIGFTIVPKIESEN